MEISRALPTKKYVTAAAHAQTPEFKQKRDRAIANIRKWASHPSVNKRVVPAVNFGYGKDGMATVILLKMAGIPFTSLTVVNGGDLPCHALVYPEFDRFIGNMKQVKYETEKRYVDYMVECLRWGQKNGMTKADGDLIDYWDMGSMTDVFSWYIADRFWGVYGAPQNDILLFSGKRGAEAMDRFYLFKRQGPFHQVEHKSKEEDSTYSYWAGYPLHDWKDVDVWALLVSHNCPISEIYSYHQIPQKGGKQAFPRTYWYAEPLLMNAQFYRWLAHYAPAQLKELIDFFPEIDERIKRSKTQEAVAV
jgi:hypothetical protein